MGILSWLFGKNEEEAPPEPLVLGAKLRCLYGSQTSYLYVDSDNISINNLPKACVEDSEVLYNIQPFGKCYAGYLCEFLISLDEKWVNAEPQNTMVNGKEIITTKSTLTCNANGRLIEVLTSGQDGIFANQLLLIREMEQKYPGLREILEDPYGSLYLNEGMYEIALQFLDDRLEQGGGSIELIMLYDSRNLEGEYIRAALDRLLTDCDAQRHEKFMEGLTSTAVQQGMDTASGWDPNYLNAAMMELLRKDCSESSERIKTNGVYRFMEENKAFSSWLREGTEAAAYASLAYAGSVGGSSQARRGKENAKPAKKTGESTPKKVEEGSKAGGTTRQNNSPKINGAKFNKGGSGANNARKETELFMPDEAYNKQLPKFTTPGTKSLPKYDEWGNLKQIKYYDDYGREIGWIDYSNHGYPANHTVPHWHEVQWNAQYPIGGYQIDHRMDMNPPFGN